MRYRKVNSDRQRGVEIVKGGGSKSLLIGGSVITNMLKIITCMVGITFTVEICTFMMSLVFMVN